MKPTIYEQRFAIDHPLIKSIFGKVTSDRPKPYAQVVFYNKAKPRVIAAELVYLNNGKKEFKTFNKLIKPDLTYDECLVVSTLYYDQKYSTIKRIVETKTDTPNELEFLLKPTNGYIIYCYQFEQIAQLVLGFSSDESIVLRKHFNKVQTCLDEFLGDKEKLSRFKGLLNKHLITNTVRFPNYSGATNLFLYAGSTR